MEKINFLSLIDFLNQNSYVKNGVQGDMKVVHLDIFDSGML